MPATTNPRSAQGCAAWGSRSRRDWPRCQGVGQARKGSHMTPYDDFCDVGTGSAVRYKRCVRKPTSRGAGNRSRVPPEHRALSTPPLAAPSSRVTAKPLSMLTDPGHLHGQCHPPCGGCVGTRKRQSPPIPNPKPGSVRKRVHQRLENRQSASARTGLPEVQCASGHGGVLGRTLPQCQERTGNCIG